MNRLVERRQLREDLRWHSAVVNCAVLLLSGDKQITVTWPN